ncbi:MAG: CPBP family intramembrane glutamic endopeptidase, partial [bacterium]
TKTYFKFSLILAIGSLLIFGSWIYFNISKIQNPVPVHWPFDTLIIIGIGFAIYLSVVEEIIFRSFIYERAKSATDAKIALPMQAALFGLMYYSHGIPDKIAGVILGSLLGMTSGYLVYKTNSIYLAILVHFIVTLGIFFELAIVG